MTEFEFELTDLQWEKIASVMPKQQFAKGGRPRADSRNTVNGILWTLATGKKWNVLPARYGSAMTCWRRFQLLQKTKIWPSIWSRYIKYCNSSQKKMWTESFISGKFTPYR